jgi:pSer/pThr/pTyr-binding forkhead associated (FHA) protein
MSKANQPTQPTKPRAFRLRGEPEGVKISALVKAGAKSIGSSPTSDIVVPVFGVSKEHGVPGAAC